MYIDIILADATDVCPTPVHHISEDVDNAFWTDEFKVCDGKDESDFNGEDTDEEDNVQLSE